jgi:hypothetical protein
MTYGQRPGEQSWRSGQYPGGNWQWGQGADERPGDPRYARQGDAQGLEPSTGRRDDQWRGGDGRWQPPEWRYAQRKDETRRWYDQTYGQGGHVRQGSAPRQHPSQQWQQQNGQSSPPPWPSQRSMYAGPVHPPQRGQSWPARHKVLTGALSSAALLIIVIAAVNAGKPPSSPGSGTTAGLTTSASAAPTASTMAPASTAVTASAAAASAPSEAASQPAVTAPVPTAPAAVVVPPASTAPASCTPLTDGGKCYEPGEYCRDDDHGASGVAGDGEAITCEDNGGWRWEPA